MRFMSFLSCNLCLCLLLLSLAGGSARASDDFERAPIRYSESTPENRISKLQENLASGKLTLEYKSRVGYLPALLEALEVPVSSQTLVFSKTSLQRNRIAPRRPRALYFNDDTYVGFCQAGDVVEISVADPELGAVFYTLDQRNEEEPTILRQTGNCLACHSSSRTEGVPGHLVRSMFVDQRGEPILSAGSRTVDHTTPIAERWGGWYVTGTHGKQTHMGNLVVDGRDVPDDLDTSHAQNVTDLNDYFTVSNYLSPHSDIVALMVLEHQVLVHNRIAKAGYAVRSALHYQEGMNRALGEPLDNRLESTTWRIESAGNDLVEALLLVGEAPLTAPLQGTSTFADDFQKLGPHDPQGRSLRELDLERRIFKYPCSYLIYSDAFQQLPEEMRDYVWKRLDQILAGEFKDDEEREKYAHLTEADRVAIREILKGTVEDLPAGWE